MFRHQLRTLLLTLSVFFVLVALPIFSAAAQNQFIRPPVRRPSNGLTVRTASGVTSSNPNQVSGGLSVCYSGIFDSGEPFVSRVYAYSYWILGLAPADGAYDVTESSELISFWLSSDQNNTFSITRQDLQAVSDAGGNINNAVLIGYTYSSDNRLTWLATGKCSNLFIKEPPFLSGAEVDYLNNLYNFYFTGDETSPNRPVSLSDTVSGFDGPNSANSNVPLLVPTSSAPTSTRIPLPLPTAPAVQIVSRTVCDKAGSTLSIGALASPVMKNINLRSQHNTVGEPLGQLQVDEQVEVISGPVCDNDRVWWEVLFEGHSAWMAEIDQDGEVLLYTTG